MLVPVATLSKLNAPLISPVMVADLPESTPMVEFAASVMPPLMMLVPLPMRIAPAPLAPPPFPLMLKLLPTVFAEFSHNMPPLDTVISPAELPKLLPVETLRRTLLPIDVPPV